MFGGAGLLTAAMPMDALRALQSLPPSPRMPVLFLGHGSPMNAIGDNAFTRGFAAVAADMPRPAAVLCISAHWYTRGTRVMVNPHPRTIHDFYGFPQALHEVNYPAPGMPLLAEETLRLLHPAPVMPDAEWGLDHGAWSVLIHLFPKADIPVVQLSLDAELSPQRHFELAAQLAPLRDRGVLIVGSGNIVHNLSLADFSRLDEAGYGYDWAAEARAQINGMLISGDNRSLVDYARKGKAWQLAIPTPDHFLPLLYATALRSDGERISLFNDELLAGSLSMTSVRIG